MTISKWLGAIAIAITASGFAAAQVPAGSTGMCKDGSYTTAASKSGACRGHKGVQDWYTGTGAATGAKPIAAAPVPTAMTPAAKTAVAPTSPAPAAPMPKPAPMAAAPTPTPTSTKAAAPSGTRMSPAAAAAARPLAAGGGPGLVWVNSDSKVYHCPGSDFYGKTKQGAYMSETDAKAKGAHADHNKPCMK